MLAAQPSQKKQDFQDLTDALDSGGITSEKATQIGQMASRYLNSPVHREGVAPLVDRSLKFLNAALSGQSDAVQNAAMSAIEHIGGSINFGHQAKTRDSYPELSRTVQELTYIVSSHDSIRMRAEGFAALTQIAGNRGAGLTKDEVSTLTPHIVSALNSGDTQLASSASFFITNLLGSSDKEIIQALRPTIEPLVRHASRKETPTDGTPHSAQVALEYMGISKEQIASLDKALKRLDQAKEEAIRRVLP